MNDWQSYDPETETVAVAEVVERVPEQFRAFSLNPYLHDTETEPVETGPGSGYPWSHLSPVKDREADLYEINATVWGDYSDSMVDRANFVAISEDYPDDVTTLGQSTHDGQALAVPARGRISETLADVLVGFRDYPLIDDEALSNLEMMQVSEDWGDWGDWDLRREIADRLEIDSDDFEDIDVQAIAFRAYQSVGFWPYAETATTCILWDSAVLEYVTAEVKATLP